MVYKDRKIRDKERAGRRGPKQRYAVWRAEHNRKWEVVFEKLTRQLCADHGLVVEDHMVADERIPWEHTWDKLQEKGLRLISRSIRDIQTEVEEQGCSLLERKFDE